MKTTKAGKPVPYPECRGSVDHLSYPAFAEIKFDGEYTVIHWHRDLACLAMNKNGKCREDFCDLNEIKARLERSEATSATLMAELYYSDGHSGRLYDLLSNKENDDLHLAVFDCVGLNGTHIGNQPFIERREVLHELLSDSLFMPEGRIVNNRNELDEFFSLKCVQGYEGIVAKNLDSTVVMGPCSWAKMKYKDRSDYSVIQIDNGKERIEVAVTGRNTSNQITVTNVGVKAPNKYKKHISLGDSVTIEHQGVLPSGSLRHPVLIPRKEWK